MRFVDARTEFEFSQELNRDSQALVVRLDQFVVARAWPEIVVTDIKRTRDDMRRLYSQIGNGLVEKLRTGAAMTASEKQTALALHAMTPPARMEWAAKKFSWHLVLCAVDVRNHDVVNGKQRRRYHEVLTPDEVEDLREEYKFPMAVMQKVATRHDAVEAWLTQHCQKPSWELVMTNHGTGPHWHIARRDFAARAKFGLTTS